MKKIRVVTGRILMGVGALMILAAGGLFGYNEWIDYSAGKTSANTASAVMQQITVNHQQTAQRTETTEKQCPQPVELNGERYLGILDIPGLELVLPVRSEWSYEKLKQNPCLYSGSFRDGGIVIAAHNYSNHFGNLYQLAQGDAVILMDADGNRYTYTVQEISVLEATAVKEMTDSDYDLSLFTCNYDGTARLTVRCALDNPMTPYLTMPVS